ncbi:MAG: TMEM175 family protein [Gaiellales bacterium]
MDEQADEGLGRGRLEAISDGIMAVAITLLALDIHAPTRAPGQSLLQALDGQTLGAIGLFALSFFLIARYWLVHHRLFSGLPPTVSTRFVVLNFCFLAAICLVPFATTTYSDNTDDMTALVVYTAVLAAASVLLTLMFRESGAPRDRRGIVIPLALLSAIPLGLLLGPQNAPIAWAALLVLDGLIAGRRPHRAG